MKDYPYCRDLDQPFPYYWECEIVVPVRESNPLSKGYGQVIPGAGTRTIVLSGRILAFPYSSSESKRISAQLVDLNISGRLGEHNPAAAARLLAELQGN